MTIVNTSTMILIGNLPPIDNDESNFDTDNAGSLAGTYSSYDDLEVVDVTNHDVDEDGAIYDDEVGGSDFVTYSHGGASYTEVPDASITYFAQVIEDDGTVHNIEVLVVQMTNGDVFVSDLQNLGNMDNLTIRSIELVSPGTTNAYGYYTSQTTSNTTVCFAAGTYIDTPRGPIRIETLRAGDMVTTRDRGAQPIVWIGSTRASPAPRNATVDVAANALGDGYPATPLQVSSQHRMLVRSDVAARMFGLTEVLVPARQLIGLPGIVRGSPSKSVRYWHLLMERHNLVLANGAWAETLLPGSEARKVLDSFWPPVNRPSPVDMDRVQRGARLIPQAHRARQLVRRHRKNKKPLFVDAPAAALSLVRA
ncbi:MAG: Hint domain-containing protein [Pseudomonadota bacterium]